MLFVAVHWSGCGTFLPFVAPQLTAVIGGIGDMSPMAREGRF
jgi:hypothetical protein